MTKNPTPAASASRAKHHRQLAAVHLWMARTGKSANQVPAFDTLPDPAAEIAAKDEALRACLDFWNKPRPATFSGNKERMQELETIKAKIISALRLTNPTAADTVRQ